MTGASIDVQRPPHGWSHLSGPLLHVLVALGEDDSRYAPALAAAATGDLDDVLDVLAAQGLRRTPAFVAVAGAGRPRVVTHADGYAVLTSSRGTLEVRAPHGRVWSDVLADADVQTVALRVDPVAPGAAVIPAEPKAPVEDAKEDRGPQEGHNPPSSEASPVKPVEAEPVEPVEVLPPRGPSRIRPVEPPPPATGDLIADVPWRRAAAIPEPIPEPEPGPAPEPEPTPELAPTPTGPNPLRAPDDADATVDRAALLAAQPAGGTGPLPSGPSVLAVLCPGGHLNPPTAGRCRACGREVPDQEPFRTPRPPLGVLRLSTGDIVTLDRGVVMGRAPQAPPGLPPEVQPHVVRIASPERDISRNHVQVVVEGWQVLVR
ncbi:MAG: hypothetical protein ABJA89_02880, partial [Lapillicoccus sp.]